MHQLEVILFINSHGSRGWFKLLFSRSWANSNIFKWAEAIRVYLDNFPGKILRVSFYKYASGDKKALKKNRP